MTQQNEKLTIEQKIAIARLAIEGLNSQPVTRNGVRAVFDVSGRGPLFPDVYHYLVDFLTKKDD